MNEIIARGLLSQLDVLRKYIVDDYPKECEQILGETAYHDLRLAILMCSTYSKKQLNT